MIQRSGSASWKTEKWKSFNQNRVKRNEDTLKHLDNIKCTNSRILSVTEGDEKDKKAESILEVVVAENSPNKG